MKSILLEYLLLVVDFLEGYMILSNRDVLNVLDCIRDLDMYLHNIGYYDKIAISSILFSVNPIVETINLYGSTFRVSLRRIGDNLELIDFVSHIAGLNPNYILQIMNSVLLCFRAQGVELASLKFNVGVCDISRNMCVQGTIEYNKIHRAHIRLLY